MDDNTRERFARICRVLSGYTNEISDGVPLGEQDGGLGLDSIDLIELSMAVEEEFTIDIDDSEIDNPDTATFGGMLALIERKRAALTVG